MQGTEEKAQLKMPGSGMHRRILGLAGPSILANMTVPLVGLVDLAITGHIGNASVIGGIAIGTMLFNLLYWNFGFLRVGTSGITAQAYGRQDFETAMDTFSQGIVTALGSALVIWAIQLPFLWVCFKLMDCTAESAGYAKIYFFIRIWAAPATLSLMSFKGWFIGMQDTISPMIDDIVVNVVNIVSSYLLAVTAHMGIAGVAWGTVIAQYTGIIVAVVIMLVKFKKYLPLINLKRCIHWKLMKSFFGVNVNLFIRSLCFMVIYVGFTALASKYGDVQLAVSNIMMQLLMIFSYFCDGFAYAGEALCGRYIGEKNLPDLKECVKDLFIWTMSIGVIFTLLYWVAGLPMFELMTSDRQVTDASKPYLAWLVAMPFVSCAAFMWDGVYIGATATVPVRNAMIAAAVGFVASYYLTAPFVGVNAIYIAYFVHLAVRAVWLTVTAKQSIFVEPFL